MLLANLLKKNQNLAGNTPQSTQSAGTTQNISRPNNIVTPCWLSQPISGALVLYFVLAAAFEFTSNSTLTLINWRFGVIQQKINTSIALTLMIIHLILIMMIIIWKIEKTKENAKKENKKGQNEGDQGEAGRPNTRPQAQSTPAKNRQNSAEMPMTLPGFREYQSLSALANYVLFMTIPAILSPALVIIAIELRSIIRIAILISVLVAQLIALPIMKPFRKSRYYCQRVLTAVLLTLVLAFLMTVEMQTTLKEVLRYTSYGWLMVILLTVLLTLHIMTASVKIVKKSKNCLKKREIETKTEKRRTKEFRGEQVRAAEIPDQGEILGRLSGAWTAPGQPSRRKSS